MNISEQKKRLKLDIDKVDDPALLDYISNLLNPSEDMLMTEEQLAIVNERREAYRKDPSLLRPFEDFKAEIKKKYGF